MCRHCPPSLKQCLPLRCSGNRIAQPTRAVRTRCSSSSSGRSSSPKPGQVGQPNADPATPLERWPNPCPPATAPPIATARQPRRPVPPPQHMCCGSLPASTNPITSKPCASSAGHHSAGGKGRVFSRTEEMTCSHPHRRDDMQRRSDRGFDHLFGAGGWPHAPGGAAWSQALSTRGQV